MNRGEPMGMEASNETIWIKREAEDTNQEDEGTFIADVNRQTDDTRTSYEDGSGQHEQQSMIICGADGGVNSSRSSPYRPVAPWSGIKQEFRSGFIHRVGGTTKGSTEGIVDDSRHSSRSPPSPDGCAPPALLTPGSEFTSIFALAPKEVADGSPGTVSSARLSSERPVSNGGGDDTAGYVPGRDRVSCEVSPTLEMTDGLPEYFKHRESLDVNRYYGVGTGVILRESVDVCHRPIVRRPSHFNGREEKPFRCQVCGKVCLTSGNLRVHEGLHAGEGCYQCRYCTKAFGDATSLTAHERVHAGERPHRCSHCGKTFKQPSGLRSHEAIHARKGPSQLPCTTAQMDSKQLKENVRGDVVRDRADLHRIGEKCHRCDHCAAAFADESSLRRHARGHTGERPPHTCQRCGGAFSNASSFRRHVRIHTNERPYECNYCASAFNDPSSFKRHERLHARLGQVKKPRPEAGHVERPPESTGSDSSRRCKFCGKVFQHQNYVKVHERRHTGEKPHRCGYCDKSFVETSSLKKHVRTHTGERPYKCKYCSKPFVESSTARRHERLHVSEDIPTGGARDSVCGVETNVNGGQLDLTGVGGRLDIISARTVNNGSSESGRSPSEKKLYQCGYCDRAFAVPSSLKKHVRIHTGERPYICRYCSKTSTEPSDHARHVRSHTTSNDCSIVVGTVISLRPLMMQAMA